MKILVFRLDEEEFLKNINYIKFAIVSKDFDLLDKYKIHNAGLDLYSTKKVVFQEFESKIIPTGVKVLCPVGYYYQVYPRSSLSLKTPFMLGNSVGVIDSSYRGEVGIILKNVSPGLAETCRGQRYAQLILSRYIPFGSTEIFNPAVIKIFYVKSERIFNEWEKLFPSERGSDGYGSTGS